MSKEIKLLLKDAKLAYSEKQFKVAEGNEVLKSDPSNYNANLLIGAIYQETSPTQAAKYLYKATECPGDPSSAFQGLLKCVPFNELPLVCKKYLQRVPTSYEKVHKQLENCALVVKTTSQCLEILEDEINSDDENRVLSAHKTLIKIYMSDLSIDRSWWKLFRKAFEAIVSDQTFGDHCKIYIKYLKILRNLKEYDVLLPSALEMLNLYPAEYIPLDMVCLVYVKKYQEEGQSITNNLPRPIIEYADEVLEMGGSHPSENALLTKAIYLFETENYATARDFFKRANNIANDDPLCLRLLADTYLKLHAFTLAEYYYVRVKSSDLPFVQSLIEQNSSAKSQDAIVALTSIESSSELNADEKVLLTELFAKAYIQTGQADLADEKIASLPTEAKRNVEIYKLLHGSEYEKCLQLLTSFTTETCEYLLRLGQCHFNLNQYAEALSAFLRATKHEPYNSDCFFWLGKLYMKNDDRERARKCFEKSVFLNPQQEQSVILLSTIYRQQSQWELNEKLLQTAAQLIPNTPCKWATLFLGFHHLAQNHFDDAIAAFRTVLRIDPNHFASWEGLADSYLKRGSFNSALKVYRKICELDEDNIYAHLQVANVLTTMRLHKDAILCNSLFIKTHTKSCDGAVARSKAYENVLAVHPNYVPALKGNADAHLGIANYYLEQRLVGRSKASAEAAVAYLIRALQQRNNFICLWRLLANCFDFIASLPTSKANLTIPGSLANESAEFVTLHGDKLYELASRFYCRAIKFNTDDLSLWYELALNYYNRSIKYGTSESRKKYLDLAAEATKHIIKAAPQKWKYWNLLGVICVTKDVQSLALAQHCFIKALEIDRKLAIVWTNLGVLYMSQHQIKLANTAFKQAQQSDPTFANAWIGQAQVAEVLAPNETIDLLRHSITLGYHDESAIQYAYTVCSLLNDSGDQKRTRYYLEHLNAVSSAIDSITWYCNANESTISADALSFLGFLNYYQRNWRIAIPAFRSASDQFSPSSKRDEMLCNQAYSLLKADRPEEAVKALENVSEATFRSTIGLAQSYFKAKQYENSYGVYESALECLAKSDTEKSLILVALSSMVYAFQGENEAKSVLFQCIGEETRPIEALVSACALGILHGDLELSELVLKELKKYERDDNWCHHIAFLTSEFYLKQNNKQKGLKYLYSQIHNFPDKPLLRKVLANYLLNNIETNEKHTTTAIRMVQGTIVMQRTHSKREISSMNVAKLLVLSSEAMRCIDPVKSKRLAQKAIHANPLCREAWAAKQLLCS